VTAIPFRASYPSVGDVIDGKYRIVRVLGEGGMGMVAQADHLLRKVSVALKFIAPHILASEGGVDRFLNEAVLASQIPSDHVVGILDVGKLPSGAPYMVMEYLEGRDVAALRGELGEKGVPIELAIHVTLQILRALQAAHGVGVVHRDLKPSNCFVIGKDGDSEFVKLLDFGISKAPVSAGITATNAALGTPLYMSPEQARNPKTVDGRADIYSAGVILYELLGGRTPHISESGAATEVILKLFTQQPPRIESLREDLPKDLADAVHKALAHELADRFRDAREFADAIAPFAPARSAHTIERIRAFVAPDKLAAPLSAPDAFQNLGMDALAATQGVSPAARTALAVDGTAPSKPPPPSRSLPWVVAVLALAIGVTVVVAVKLGASQPTAPPIDVSSAPPPPPPSTVASAAPPASLAAPPTSASSASSAVPYVSGSGSVHLKHIGLRP
jgi:serine/threonine-protein kinase